MNFKEITEKLEKSRWLQYSAILRFRYVRYNVFQEVVKVPRYCAYDVHDWIITQQDSQQNHKIWHKAWSELDYIEEIKDEIRIFSRPKVQEHVWHAVWQKLKPKVIAKKEEDYWAECEKYKKLSWLLSKILRFKLTRIP